jgi:predicted site-specific integrase-resolvase
MSTKLPGDPRAALYARVSTDYQRDRQTMDNQVNALRGYAPHLGFNFVAEYLDAGISPALYPWKSDQRAVRWSRTP